MSRPPGMAEVVRVDLKGTSSAPHATCTCTSACNRDNPQPPAIPHDRGFASFGARVRLRPTTTSDRRPAPTIATIRRPRFVRKAGPPSTEAPRRPAIAPIRRLRRSLMIVASLGAPGSARGARLPRARANGPPGDVGSPPTAWHRRVNRSGPPPRAGTGLVRHGPVFCSGLRKSLMNGIRPSLLSLRAPRSSRDLSRPSHVARCHHAPPSEGQRPGRHGRRPGGSRERAGADPRGRPRRPVPLCGLQRVRAVNADDDGNRPLRPGPESAGPPRAPRRSREAHRGCSRSSGRSNSTCISVAIGASGVTGSSAG